MKKILLAAGRRLRRRLFPGKEAEGCSRRLPESEPAGSGAVAPPPARKAATTKRRKPKPPPWSRDSFVVDVVEGRSRFHDFAIPDPVMHAISDLDFQHCTAVQEQSLAPCLAGKDFVGKANTGTGKTAVFLISTFSRLLAEKRRGRSDNGTPRALVLAPTRELAIQIGRDARALSKYCNFSIRTVFGGTDYQQQMDLLQAKPCDLIVATPGRLLDFLGKGIVDLSRCEVLILDEADRMLDMGFIPDVRRIVGRLPSKKERQTLLFSATITDDVRRLAQQWCVEPVMVDAEPDQAAAETVEQIIYLASADEKYPILYNLIAKSPDQRVIVFTNMKGEARRLSERLQGNGVECALLSGDVPQNRRTSRLQRFRDGRVKVLVATDVAGRGIHIEDIMLVVNYTIPYEPEDYVHRIGRTGRAGASGRAVSFACEEGSFYLPAIEELLGEKLECQLPAEELLVPPPPPRTAPEKGRKAGAKRGRKKQQMRRPRRKNGGSRS